jgi:hypothetical protein
MYVLKGKFASGLRFYNNILADMFKINVFHNLPQKSRTKNSQINESTENNRQKQ